MPDLVNHQLTCQKKKKKNSTKTYRLMDERYFTLFRNLILEPRVTLCHMSCIPVCVPMVVIWNQALVCENIVLKRWLFRCIWSLQTPCRAQKSTYVLRFVVVNELCQPAILGLPACKLMKLIKTVHTVKVVQQPNHPPLVNEFSEVFNEIRKLPMEHEIRLATGTAHVDPVVSAEGCVPFSLAKRVFDKLNQMVALKIIAPVVGRTE